MTRLARALDAWRTPEFNDILKNEIENLDAEYLPLQQGLVHSSYASNDDFKAIVINVREDDEFLHVKAGIFYSGSVAGCNCADDPTPVSEQSEYCEIALEIRKTTAETRIALLD